MKSFSILAILLVATPAFAQMPTSDPKIEAFVSKEEAYRDTVSADSVNSALNEARHQCRAWSKKHPQSIEDAQRVMSTDMMRAVVIMGYASATLYATPVLGAAFFKPTPEQKEALATIRCSRVINPSPATSDKK